VPEIGDVSVRRLVAVLLPALLLLAAPQARAADCEIAGVERVVAVGDVHGAYDRLARILRAADLVDEQLRWTGGRAHLVQMGDLLDRGPDSRKALDLLRRLEREARRAKGAVHALLGNHEVMRMLGDNRYVSPGEYAAFAGADAAERREQFLKRAAPESRAQLLKELPLGLLEMTLAFGPDGEYGKWLRGLNAVLKVDGVVFVHGGISPAVAGQACGEINRTVRREITEGLPETRQRASSSLAAREDGPLWYRGLAQEPEPAFAPAVDQILEKQQARAIVVAHTITASRRIEARFGGKVIQVDTGMLGSYVPDGRASALEIKGGTFTAIYEDRREVLIAPQRAASLAQGREPR
jgi:hypothetical protein